MDAADAADSITDAAEGDDDARQKQADERFRRLVAVAIGVLAMLLAITGLGGDDASTGIVNANIEVTDTFAFFQARNIRQTSTQLAADEMEILLRTRPDLPPDVRAEIEGRIERYKATVARFESDPVGGEGKQELLAKARALEEDRDRRQRQDPNFDYAEALYQIAIVLASVSIVAASRRLFALSLALGAVATVLMLNGFLLFFDLPIG